MKSFALLLAAFSAPQACWSDAVTSKFNVLIPKQLNKADGYDHRDAMFGIPPYGGSIQQPLYYAGTNNLCDSSTTNKLDTTGWSSPFILLVDRGDCSFVQKVRNSQRAGASAVLIADDICICGRDECASDDDPDSASFDPGQPYCESQEPIMADDGSGSDISIPSFLLFKEDADPIRTALINDGHVRVQMSFSVPAPDSRVEYDLWTSPADDVTRELQEDFFSAVLALQEHASFTPHMYIYDGVYAGCHGDNGEDMCLDLCTNAGRYCSVELDLNSGATGQEVVAEALRRICVWNLYGKDNGIGLPWWEYIKSFTELCDSGSFSSAGKVFSDEDCIERAMTNAGVNKTKVDLCMAESGGTTEDKNNTLLDKELRDQQTSGIVLIPSLLVNQAVIRGFLSFDTTFKAICAGFSKGSEPKICTDCANCHDEKTCVEKGFCSYHSNNGLLGIDTASGSVAFPTFLAALGLLLVLFALVGYIQYRRQNSFMRQQIQSVVAEYMPVSAQNSGASTSLALEEEEDDDNERNGTTYSLS
ncbi:hypothetical protein ACA910_000372 [Epithemia clementina (nom. ined.)]